MAEMTPSQVHTNKYLTGVSVGYKNPLFVAPTAFPVVGVNRKTDKVPMWNKADWYRRRFERRVSGKPAPVLTPSLDADHTYGCVTYEGKAAIDPELLANADNELELQTRYAEYVAYQKLLNWEIVASAATFVVGTWGTTLQITNAAKKWDQSTATPISDIWTGKNTVEDACGMPCNACIMGIDAWRSAMLSSEIINHIFGGGAPGPKVVTQALFAAAFEFDYFMVGRAMQTVTPEGTQTPVYTKVWGDACLFYYRTPNPSLLTPAAGYTFQWYDKTRSWVGEETEEQFIHGLHSIDVDVLAPPAGYYLWDIIT